MAGHPR
ncbi:hypothetical protein EC881042_1920A, partial [Escherichia coli 88.1042]